MNFVLLRRIYQIWR